MGRNIAALIAGLVFGLGLVISQMVNPAKVIAFLDIFGNWDPSLAFVMGGALIVTAYCEMPKAEAKTRDATMAEIARIAASI